jgi:hypothetical protein
MMTRSNKKIILMIAAILAISILLLGGITNLSTYLSNALVSNNQSPSPLSTNTASFSSPNWTGSIQVSKTLPQIIQSQVHATLGNAATSAEKLVGANSHATSANLREERGYLVYTVWVKDSNDNSHKVIVDPGNGKVLFTQQIFNNINDDHDDDKGQQHYYHAEHSSNNVAYEYHHHDDHHDD